MDLMKTVLFISMIFVGNGFLLQGSIPNPTSSVLMTDKHYYTLMDIITDESHARRQLQQLVVQLENEVANVKAETAFFKSEIANLITKDAMFLKMQNKTDILQNEYNFLKTDFAKLEQNHQQLQHEHTQQKLRLAVYEQEITNLKQLKVFGDLKNISYIQNSTQMLDQEIKSTNSKVDQLISFQTVRNQDFMALYRKTVLSDTKQSLLELQMNNTYALLLAKQNVTEVLENKLQKEISHRNQTDMRISLLMKHEEKVAVTSCARSPHTYNAGETIKFENVKTAVGINKLQDFKTSGTFIAEKPGLYMIAAFVMSYSHGAQFIMYKNTEAISKVFIRHDLREADKHTGTGVIAVELNINDVIRIVAGCANMNVYQTYSCLTVIKII